MDTVQFAGITFHKGRRVLDEYGIRWVAKDVTNWLNLPGTTGQVEQRSYRNGGWTDRAYSTARVMEFEGSVIGPSDSATEAAIDRLMGSIPTDELQPIVVDTGGIITHRMVRQKDDPVLRLIGDRSGAVFNFQLDAPDHRRFSGNGSGPTYSASVGLPSQAGGLVFPAAPPWLIEASVVAGSVDVVNRGNTAPPALVRIDGPVSKPVIFTDDGQSMRFDVDLVEGQFLLIDLDKRTVLLNAQASRRGALRGQWITLSPGANTLRFDAAVYNDQARMAVSWSDSWK